jgi:hypothetical protein
MSSGSRKSHVESHKRLVPRERACPLTWKATRDRKVQDERTLNFEPRTF